MQTRLRLHPRPLMILLAIVVCLIATAAFAQGRLAQGAPAARATSGTVTTPAPSGLTSGAAPGLTSGTPSASGITSGSAVLPSGTPSPSGLTSGASGGLTGTTTGTTGTTGGTTPDTTTTTMGGSTRGVVVLPADVGTVQAGTAGTTNGVPSVAPTRHVLAGTLTATQVALLFSQADADGDGLLTRAEALRLQVVTMSFDDMDTNRDGVVSRSEYETSLR